MILFYHGIRYPPALREKAVLLGGEPILKIFILLSTRALSQTCSETPFPKFIGGFDRDTYYTSIDYHTDTSQLVVGGSTYDMGITNSHANIYYIPIIVMYQGDYFSYSWGVYIESPANDDEVWSISISSDG